MWIDNSCFPADNGLILLVHVKINHKNNWNIVKLCTKAMMKYVKENKNRVMFGLESYCWEYIAPSLKFHYVSCISTQSHSSHMHHKNTVQGILNGNGWLSGLRRGGELILRRIGLLRTVVGLLVWFLHER